MKKFLFNRALKNLILTNGIVLVAAAMLGPIIALFVEGVGGSLLDASLAGGVFAIAAGLTSLLSGKYTDSIKNQKNVVSLGYLLMGLGFFLFIFVNSIWFLLGVQVLIGMAEAIYSPAFDALFSKHLSKHKEAKEWGAWESMNYFTAGVGAIIGGVIVTLTSFDVIFIIMAMLCAVSGIYIYKLPKKVL